MPYGLVFNRTVRIEICRAIIGEAFGGLAGSEWWRLEASMGRTDATYSCDVRTTRLWVSLLARVVRPFFAWNHDMVMRWGEGGL